MSRYRKRTGEFSYTKFPFFYYRNTYFKFSLFWKNEEKINLLILKIRNIKQKVEQKDLSQHKKLQFAKNAPTLVFWKWP